MSATACVVIDAHGHIGPVHEFPYVDSTPEGLIAAMDQVGIDRVYVSGTCGFTGGGARRGNDFALDAARKFPGRIFGYMTADVGYPDEIEPELERCYDAGLRAVKIWTQTAIGGLPYDHANYQIIFRGADERGLPLLAHTWGEELDHLAEAMDTYRKVTWILAHAGAAEVEKYIDVARKHPHVYLETCFSVAPRGLIERLVRDVGAEKILWGTDQLFLCAAQQIGRVLFARISPDEKRMLLGENAAKIFAREAEDG